VKLYNGLEVKVQIVPLVLTAQWNGSAVKFKWASPFKYRYRNCWV